jgi:hypothetical protein
MNARVGNNKITNTMGTHGEASLNNNDKKQIFVIIIIFLSSNRSIETCYGRYKTESFNLFKVLSKFLFPFGWYFKIIFVILSELILSTCSFQLFLY